MKAPYFLQPSAHRVPDLVAALHSGAFAINVHLHARQDSVDESIRTTFEDIPDVPLTRFVLSMDGGKKGLLVNSTDLCASRHRIRCGCGGRTARFMRPTRGCGWPVGTRSGVIATSAPSEC